jgi:hypothetical protein
MKVTTILRIAYVHCLDMAQGGNWAKQPDFTHSEHSLDCREWVLDGK